MKEGKRKQSVEQEKMRKHCLLLVGSFVKVEIIIIDSSGTMNRSLSRGGFNCLREELVIKTNDLCLSTEISSAPSVAHSVHQNNLSNYSRNLIIPQ